jgi:hypothetical protein
VLAPFIHTSLDARECGEVPVDGEIMVADSVHGLKLPTVTRMLSNLVCLWP